MEPMKGKWASSRIDLGYTELFCIPEVRAVFLSFCDSGLGNSLVFHQENRGSLYICLGIRDCSDTMQGNRSSSPPEGIVSWEFPSCGRTLGYILELQRGWPIETPLCSRSQDYCLVMTDTSGI